MCEICGEKVAVAEANVDGVKMKVCEGCSKFGNRIEKREVKSGRRNHIPDEREEDILPDFPQKVRDARNAAGLTRKEFAEKLNEKVGVIENIEAGKRLPSLSLAKKIEKTFSIRLVGSITSPETKTNSLPGMTLGDLVKVKDYE